MRRAWTIARTTGKAFNICLVKAWSLYRLTQRMRAGVVRFAYEKADGTLRMCTRMVIMEVRICMFTL